MAFRGGFETVSENPSDTRETFRAQPNY